MNRTFKSQTQIFYIKSVIATKLGNCGANYRAGQTVTDTEG